MDFDVVDNNDLKLVEAKDNVEEEIEEEEEIVTTHYEDNITAADVKQIGTELGIIDTCWPKIESPDFENRTQFPHSYITNSEKEKLILLYAENFRQQFKHLYPHRKILVLAAKNECGLQKFVCNTIRPTTLPYLELKNWKGCTRFVADYFNYEVLDKPTLPPEHILGPATISNRQLGNSYEISTGLCSLLIGAGYNAFVVSGIATKDVTTNIRYRTQCPIKTIIPQEEVVEEEQIENKYKLRAVRDLRSQFLLFLEQREIDRAKAKIQAQLEKERKERQEREKAPFDELHGYRYHAWILLLPRFDVTEPTFIEPSTGEIHPIDTKIYVSLESIWNTENYWVNIQNCSKGLGSLQFNLTDTTCWEHLLIGEPFEFRARQMNPEIERDDTSNLDEKHLDVPPSWSEPIVVPHDCYSMRYPKGVKRTRYNRVIIHQHGDYMQHDGLKHKIYYYSDFECLDLLRIEDTYEYRTDRLIAVIYDVKTDIYTEYFNRGREDACKMHTYKFSKNSLEAARVMEYYSAFRLDGLSKLETDPSFLKEYFKKREDFLNFRHTVFAERGKPPPGMAEGTRRIVISITERYNRNEAKDANDDIALRIFAIVDNTIHLQYHYAKGNVTASTRTFEKPKVANRGDELQFSPELTTGYQAQLDAKPPKPLDLYYLMLEQITMEQNSLFHLREIEDEVNGYIRARAIENAVPQLEVSLFNREQNEEYKQGLEEKEEQQRMHHEREIDEDVDYLSPYLIRFDVVEVADEVQARHMKRDCLKEFKDLLTSRINHLRTTYEKEYMDYSKKQLYFSKNLSTFSLEEEEAILNLITHKRYLLHLYDRRIRRLIELSRSRYLALEKYLEKDPRLAVLRIGKCES